MGAVSDKLNLVQNPDMERKTGSQPTGWWSGGTVTPTFSAIGPTTDAATGNYYAQLQVRNTTPGTVWTCHNSVVVQGKSRLYENFYFRSNMNNIGVDVHEYNSSGVEIRVTSGPRITASDGTWHSYLQNIAGGSGWYLPLQSNTYDVITCIVGNFSPQISSHLDVDTVSVSAR